MTQCRADGHDVDRPERDAVAGGNESGTYRKPRRGPADIDGREELQGVDRRTFLARVAAVVATATLPSWGVAPAAAQSPAGWPGSHDGFTEASLDALGITWPRARGERDRARARAVLAASYRDSRARSTIDTCFAAIASGVHRDRYSSDAATFQRMSRKERLELMQRRLKDTSGSRPGPSPERPVLAWGVDTLSQVGLAIMINAVPGVQRFEADSVIASIQFGASS